MSQIFPRAGLDYCAGEVDLLDAVPGYQTAPSMDLFTRVVEEVGCAVIGPTLDLAPADRKLFFVRDVTATVESVPLITGSIVSKKLAVAPHGLTITVGSGSGAYMRTLEDARQLATYMAEVAARVGVPSVMLLTDLDCVLGASVGNAVAVQETVEFLLGRHRDSRVLDLVLSVVAEMVALAGVERDPAAARRWRRRDWRTAQLRSISGAWSRHWVARAILSKERLPISPWRRLYGPSCRRLRASFPAWTRARSGTRWLSSAAVASILMARSTSRWGSPHSRRSTPKSRAKARLPSCMLVTK